MSLSPYPPPNAPSRPPGRRQPPLTPTPVAGHRARLFRTCHIILDRFHDEQRALRILMARHQRVMFPERPERRVTIADMPPSLT
jgi:hypothetical protein